jgi:hypothetical protein
MGASLSDEHREGESSELRHNGSHLMLSWGVLLTLCPLRCLFFLPIAVTCSLDHNDSHSHTVVTLPLFLCVNGDGTCRDSVRMI